MDLYLIRQAEAAAADRSIDDALRPLTARGRKDARMLGEALARAGVALDALVTSPLVRAVETAELVAVGLERAAPLDVAVELAPPCGPEAVIEEAILPRAELASIALVGHEPQLGALLGVLMHARAQSFAKATAVRLRWDGPESPARFEWVLSPEGGRPSST
jgi:phosphohistidine phosphatase